MQAKFRFSSKKTLPSFEWRKLRRETWLLEVEKNNHEKQYYQLQDLMSVEECNLRLPFKITLKPSHICEGPFGSRNIIFPNYLFTKSSRDILLYFQWSLENWWSNAANWIGPENKIFQQKGKNTEMYRTSFPLSI